MYTEPYEARKTSRGCNNWVRRVIESVRTKEQAQTAYRLALNFFCADFEGGNPTLHIIDATETLGLAIDTLKKYQDGSTIQ